MALCSIDKKKLFQAVDNQLRKNLEAKKPFATKDITKFIYDLALKNSGKEDVGLSYAALTPYMIAETIRLKREYNEHAVNTNFDFNDIQKVNLTILKAGDKILERAAEYIELKKPITPEVVDTAKKDLKARQIQDEKDKAAISEEDIDFEARPDTLLSTTGQQALDDTKYTADPLLAPYYDFIKVLNIDNKTEQGGVVYPGVEGGLYITFMPGSKIPEKQRKAYDIKKYKIFESTVFLVLTDINGKPVSFDANFEVVNADEGMLLYYQVRVEKKQVSEKAKNVSKEQTILRKIAESVIKNGENYISEIVGKSVGYPGEELVKKENEKGETVEVPVWKTISSISNAQNISLVVAKNKNNRQDVFAKVKDSPQVYEVKKNKFSAGRIQMIAELIEEEVFDAKGKLLTINQKYNILKNWFSYNTKGIKLTSKKNDKVYLKIGDKFLNDTKDSEKNKQIIIDALSTDKYGNQATIPITYSFLGNTNEEIDVFMLDRVNKRLSIISNVQPYEKHLKDNLSVKFDLSEVDKSVNLLNGYWIYQPIGPLKNAQPEKKLAKAQKSIKNELEVKEVAEGVKIIDNALTKSEELEIFKMIKPFLESQGSKTNRAKAAPIMIGLGLRWDYKSNNVGRSPVEIKETIVNAEGQRNKYAYYDVSIDGEALGEIPSRLKELITKATGVDASNYDGAIINIYQKDGFISAHNDVDESVTAMNYPVLVANIGGTGSLSIEGAESQKSKKGYSNKEYIDEPLSSGSAYIFGENGKNRKVFHRTLPSSGKGNLPQLNIKGKVIPANSYRMTVTLRRVKDLEQGMPTAPDQITQQTNQNKPKTSENLTDVAIKGMQLTLFDQPIQTERKKETEVKIQDVVSDKTKETKETKVEKKEIKKASSENIQEDDDILKGLSKDDLDLLNKLTSQASEASKSQMSKALAWYNSIVLSNGVKLSDVVPLTVMFNAVNESNPNSIAHWTMAGITLYKGSNYTDLYHEAWHAFTQQFLSSEERTKLYDATRNKKGTFTDYSDNEVSFKDATNLQLEEYLAEEFRSFMLNPGKSKYTKKSIIGKIFDKIKELLKWLFNKTDIADIYNDSQATNHISKLFNQLRVGNLNAPINRPANFTREGLYKSKSVDQKIIHSAENPDIIFTKEESLIISQSIDALFGDYINQINETNKSGTFAGGGLLQKSLKAQKLFYQRAKSAFLNKEEEYIEALQTELKSKNPNARKIKKLRSQIDLLNRAIDVFIIPENEEDLKKMDGVLLTHSAVSEYLKTPAEIEEEQNLLNNNVYSDRGGNSKSAYEMLSSELTFVLSTIHKRDRNGNIKHNWLGFPETMHPKTVTDILGNFLELSDPINRPKTPLALYIKMKELEDELPLIKDVLSKIGSPSTMNTIQNKYWSQISVLLLPTVDIVINDIVVSFGDYNENNELDVVAERVTMHSTNDPSVKIFKQFKRITQSFLPGQNEYIYRLNNSNYIDIEKVLADFDGVDKKNIRKFLEAIGIYLPDTKDINNKLSERKYIDYAKFLRAAVWNINSFNKKIKELGIGKPIKIYSAEDIVNDMHYARTYKTELNKIKQKTKKTLILPKGQSNEKKAFAKLFFKYSEISTNSSHTSADGKTKYSKSLPNTLTVFTDIINESETYVKVQSDEKMNSFNTETSSFAKVSLVLSKIYGKNLGEKLEKAGLKIIDLDGMTIREDTNTLIAHKSIASTPNAKQVIDIVAMLIYGAPEATRHAGKSSTFGIVVLNEQGVAEPYLHQDLFKSNSQTEEFGKISLGKLETISIFKNYLAAEYERIQRTKEEWAKKVIVAGGKGKKDNKHTLAQSGQDFILFGDIITEDLQKKLKNFKAETVEEFLEELEENKKLNDDVELEIFNYLTNVVQQEYDDFMSIPYDDSFTKLMLLRTSGGGKVFNNLYSMIEAYAVNHLIHNVETSWLFYGDPALYKWSAEDFHKRNAGAGSTGIAPRTDKEFITYLKNKEFDSSSRSYNGQLNTVVLQDPKITATYLKEYIKYAKHQEETRLTKLNFSKKVIKAKLDKIEQKFKEAYENMDEADAQGYINFDTYRSISIAMDKWTDFQESTYQIIKTRTKNGEQNVDFSDLNLMAIFPVRKYQYWGPIKNDNYGLMAFHKYSLLPLIPGTLEETTGLETLRIKMEREEIDYLTYQTGSKISTIGNENGELDQFFSDTQTRTLGLPEKFVKNVIFADFLKEQLAIAPKFKGTTVFATQMRKLVIEGLWEKGMPVDYKGTRDDWNAFMNTNPSIADVAKVSELGSKTLEYERSISILTGLLFDELKEKVGVNLKSGNIADTEKFIKYLSDALKEKEYTTNVIEHVNSFISKLSKDGGNFDLTTVSGELEEILVGLVYKKIINQKVRGEGLVQVSVAGWQVENASDLKFYRPLMDPSDSSKVWENEDGSVVGFHAMQVKIAMQGDFKNLLEDEDVIALHERTKVSKLDALNTLIKSDTWLNKGDNRKMITMVGPRIPVQGLNSMEVIEIAEFLDEFQGNVIVLPSEIVGKSGSDFDVDKLSLVMPNIYLHKGKPTLLKYNETLAKSLGREGIQNLKSERNTLFNEKNDIYDEINELFAIKIADLKTEAKDVILKEELELLEKNYIEYRTKNNKLKARIEALQRNYKGLSHLNKNEKNQNVKRDFELEEELINLQIESQKLTDDFRKNQRLTKTIIIESKFEEKLSAIQDEIDKINLKLKTTSTQAAENSVLQNTIGLIMLPHNFVNLLTPNTTADSKEVSDNIVEKSNRYRTIHNFTRPGSGFSGTRLYEPKYNRMKGSYNSVGKDALGIAAVSNTFNVLYNRVGLNLLRTERMKVKEEVAFTRPLVIRGLDHNKTNNAISLSHRYDALNDLKISEIISQLINGYVDVEKDEWIFFLQGNKELTPILLFMLQAGVPLKQAAIFLNQPIIHEYYGRLVEKLSSTYYLEGQTPNKRTRKNDIFDDIMTRSFPDYRNLGYWNEKMQEWVIPSHERFKFIDDLFNDSRGSFNVDYLTENLGSKKDRYSIRDLQVLGHFYELARTSGKFANLQKALNVDTNKQNTLGDIAIKAKEKLQNFEIFPEDQITRLITSSPLSSFMVQDEVLELFKPLFPITASDEFIEIIENVDNNDEAEQIINRFRNAVVPFLFQLDYYKPIGDEYKGFTIKETTDYNFRGVVLSPTDPNVILYNNRSIQDLINTQNIGEIKNIQRADYMAYSLALAEVPEELFVHFKGNEGVLKYLVEREVQRSLDKNNFENISKTDQYKSYRKELKQKLAEKPDLFSEAIDITKIKDSEALADMLAYEYVLRDKALDALNLIPYLFKNTAISESYPQKLDNIIYKYPELSDKYEILNLLDISVTGKSEEWTITFDKFSLTPQQIDIYNTQLKSLTDSDNILDVLDITDQEADDISAFFKKFTVFAYIQSVAKAKTSKFNLLDLIDNKAIELLLTEPVDKFLKMNDLQTKKRILRNAFSYSTPQKSNSKSPSFGISESQLSDNQKLLFKDPEIITEEEEESKYPNDFTLALATTREFEVQNKFEVKPIKSVDKIKAKTKAKYATQLIGFGEGLQKSSTNTYVLNAGKYANTGKYGPKDVIFITVPGKRDKQAELTTQKQNQTIREAIKALEAGATLLTDNQKYLSTSSFNTGEQRLAHHLKLRGFVYQEAILDGIVVGVWQKSLLEQTKNTKRNPVTDDQIYNALLEEINNCK